MNTLKQALRTFSHYPVILMVIIIGAAVLRLTHLASMPPSPYWEEAALGYDAYSILHTGKDHHGASFPLVAFESFGDWKPSGYFYTLVPFIAVFGLSVLAVRLPTALSGIALVYIVSQLALLVGKKIYQKNTQQSAEQLSLVAAVVTALSPWSLMISRGSWEVSLATTLLTLAGWQAWKATDLTLATVANKKMSMVHWFIASLAFVGAVYTYHATRITAPLLLMGIGFGWLLQRDLLGGAKSISTVLHAVWQKMLLVLPGILLIAVLCLPFYAAIGSEQLGKRFQETSIFSDSTIIERSNAMRALGNGNVVVNLAYHRFVLFGGDVLRRFSQHLSLDYLFISGDENARHSVPFFGQLYHFELLFVLFGVVVAVRNGKKLGIPLWWLVVGILPASVTFATPHALRSFASAPILFILVAVGVLEFVQQATQVRVPLLTISRRLRKFLVVGLVIVGYLFEFLWFSRVYWSAYPKLFSQEWQYGYEQMVAIVVALEEANPQLPVYITRQQGRPAMYYWFYTKADPRSVQAANVTSKKDQGELLTYKNKEFIGSESELPTAAAIVALSEEGAKTVAGRLTNPHPVVDDTGRVVWVVGILTAL